MSQMPTEIVADPDADTGAEAEAETRINGVLDVPRRDRAAGWAIDRADAEAAVVVTILREGRVVAEVTADTYRGDLERGGIGTGRYGFSVPLEPPVEPGFEFTVTAVARTGDGTTGALRPIGTARPAEDPERRLAQRLLMEVAAVRGGLVALAGSRRDADGEGRLGHALDRIEIVQARLERTLADADPPAPAPQGRGLAAAVTVALALGATSLAVGVWSMLAG